MTAIPDRTMARFRRAFGELFDGLELPRTLKQSGHFERDEWSFRYRVNEEDGAPCLDLVAQIGGSEQLERILASGEVESGPSFREMIIFDPELDADDDAARRRFDEHNRHVGDVMRSRGLL